MIFQDQAAAPSTGNTLFERIFRLLNYPLINQEGAFKVTIISLIMLVLVLAIATMVSRYTRRFLQKRILPKFHIGIGLQYTLLRLVHYVIIGLGVLYALKIGFSIDLTNVAVIVGFLSVGIGFGLQYLAADIASGFILLFERPIRVGDWVRLDDDLEGRVEEISLRSTVVVTNENLAVIVPNSKLVQNRFVNYSYGHSNVRLNIAIGVATGSDLDKVSTALIEAARSVKEVLDSPEPRVHFRRFGDSGLDLEIRVWINEPRNHTTIRSNVYFAIDREFRKYGIEVPNPQRDLYIRSALLKITRDEPGIINLETAHTERND